MDLYLLTNLHQELMSTPPPSNARKRKFSLASQPGILMIFAVILSLGLANTGFEAPIHRWLDQPWGWEIGGLALRYSTLSWINDGLMSLFFLLIGLEIKKEMLAGELSSPRKAALPILAAIGGALIPALIYVFFNHGTPTADGWGIPMATDIAFAIVLLSMLGPRVPLFLKVFLTALAIVDDLLAILVIALFYTQELQLHYLAYAGLLLVALGVGNRLGVKNLLFYLIPGLAIWYFTHHSGIHATIAGVAVALLIPYEKLTASSPLSRLEYKLHHPVHFLILPVFAFANTAIAIDISLLSEIFSPLGYGIFFGLALGKPLGITLTTWLACKSGLAQKPSDTQWIQFIGMGCIAGVGFTMSIFISLLSFPGDIAHTSLAKIVILITSLLSALWGMLILYLWSGRTGTSPG